MKYKDIAKMNKEEREKKFKDLKVELVKSKARTSKAGSASTRQIRKEIAKIFTFNSSKGGVEKK
jgi:ribosomal protein L29